MAFLASSAQVAPAGLSRRHVRTAGLPNVHRIHSSRCQRAVGLVARAGKVTKITGEQLEVEIQDRDRPLIVDFFATWCGPCLLLAQELEKVAEQMGDDVKVLKIDVDENPQLSSQLRIEGLPTLVFIPKDPSKPALRTEGLMPASQIIDIVKDLAASGGVKAA